MALGLQVTDNGVQKPASGLWVYQDGSVGFKKATEGWVFSGGSFKRFWPAQGTIDTFGGTLGSPSFNTINLNWNTSFVNQVTLNQTSPTASTLINSTSLLDSSTAVTALPSTTYNFTLTANDPLGLSTSKDVVLTTAAVPSTAISGVSYGTLSGNVYPATVTWKPVAGVTTYNLYAINGTTSTLLQSGITASSTTVNLNAGTTYKLYVTSVYTVGGQDYASAPSTTFTTTVPAAGPPAGAYVFRPQTSRVWQSASGYGWRDSADNLYHGNGSAYGSTRGTQTSVFFGYVDSSSRGFTNAYYDNATVTKVEIYAYRNTSAGSSTATASRFTQHNHSSYSSTLTPTFGTNYDATANPLSYGEAAWLTVPNSWGTALLAGTIKGVGWGNVSSGTPSGRYMSGYYTAAANSTKTTPIGSIRITVG